MRIPFIAGNWKMHMTAAEATAFCAEIMDGLDALIGVEIAVCPTALAIPAVSAALFDSHIGVGAQNMFYEEKGAYTGELAPAMVAEFCQYVILGHSERRTYFGETDDGVNRKAKAALAHSIVPIICVGESLEQNRAGETQSFVSGQVRAALAGIDAADVPTLVFAYEPIWAIGTGLNAEADQAGDIIRSAVREPIAELYGSDIAELVRIQYGGSVKPENIAEYMAQPDIDGALVGGASLKPGFVALVAGAIGL